MMGRQRRPGQPTHTSTPSAPPAAACDARARTPAAAGRPSRIWTPARRAGCSGGGSGARRRPATPHAAAPGSCVARSGGYVGISRRVWMSRRKGPVSSIPAMSKWWVVSRSTVAHSGYWPRYGPVCPDARIKGLKRRTGVQIKMMTGTRRWVETHLLSTRHSFVTAESSKKSMRNTSSNSRPLAFGHEWQQRSGQRW